MLVFEDLNIHSPVMAYDCSHYLGSVSKRLQVSQVTDLARADTSFYMYGEPLSFHLLIVGLDERTQ